MFISRGMLVVNMRLSDLISLDFSGLNLEKSYFRNCFLNFKIGGKSFGEMFCFRWIFMYILDNLLSSCFFFLFLLNIVGIWFLSLVMM